MRTYGPYSVILYARLRKARQIESLHDGLSFIKKFIGVYLKNMGQGPKNCIALANLESLVSNFPTRKQFVELIDFHRLGGEKDMICFKLTLDMMTFYYRRSEKPLFKKLKYEVIPLALKFYKLITDQTLSEINRELLAISEVSANKNATPAEALILLFGTTKEYSHFYADLLADIENLSGGSDLSSFYTKLPIP